MSVSLGTHCIMGIGHETAAWGTTEVAATDRIPLLSEGIEFDYQDILHEYLYGAAGIPAMQRVFEPVTGTLECNIPYTEKDTTFVSATELIAHAMGTVVGDTGAGSYMMTFQDELARWMTIAWDKGQHASEVWTAWSCMVRSFSLSCAAGEAMVGNFDIIAYDLQRDDTTNQVSTLAALTTDIPALVMFSDIVFRIGDQTDVLAAGDQLSINSFTLSIDNNLSDPEQATLPSSGALDIKQPIQPVRNGFRECILEIVLPRYDTDAFLDFRAADTQLQATFEATGPAAAVSEFDIILPNMKIIDISAPVAGPEMVTQTITLRCMRKNPAKTTFPEFSDGLTQDDGEVWIETDDERVDGDLWSVAWT